MRDWGNQEAVAAWIRTQRVGRGWSQAELATRLTGLYHERTGLSRTISQQTIQQAEKAKLKSIPEWAAFLEDVFAAGDDETREDPYLDTGKTDRSVDIKLLPTYAGMGGGGSGEGDPGVIFIRTGSARGDHQHVGAAAVDHEGLGSVELEPVTGAFGAGLDPFGAVLRPFVNRHGEHAVACQQPRF